MSKHVAASLQAITTSLTSMVEICSSSNKASTISAVLTSTGSEVDSVLEQLKKLPRTYSKTKKSLVVLRNTISGMADGIAGRDLTVREFRAVCANMRDKFIARLDNSISEDQSKIPAARGTAAQIVEPGSDAPELPEDLREMRSVILSGGSLQDMLSVVRKQLADSNNRAAALPAHREADHGAAEEEEDPDPVGTKRATTLTSFYEKEKEHGTRDLLALNKFRDLFPTSLKSHVTDHTFTMVKMPIVPLFDQWNLTQGNFLTKLGIPHLPLSGYMIFKDQLLLVVSKSAALKAAAATSAKKRKSSVPATDKKMRMLDFTREAQKVTDYANVILSIVNEKSSSNTYSIVSDKFVSNPKNQDLVCFWIMGTKKLSALIRSAGFGSSKVKSWGFPWVDNAHPASEVKDPASSSFVHPSNNPKHPNYLEYDKNKGMRPEGWKSSDVPYRRSIG